MPRKRSRSTPKEKAGQKRRERAYADILKTTNRKRYFSNPQPLTLPEDTTAFPGSYPRWKLHELDLMAFPEVDDFQIFVFKTEMFGYQLSFNSPVHGILTTFPWWSHVEKDLSKWGHSEIPIGDIQRPYFDADQSWQLLIFAHKDRVYILQGNESGSNEFHTWYRVDLGRYQAEWTRLREKFKR